jgi:ribosomal-protein-alanine N-acetyltransferase
MLETERLILRRLEDADADAIYAMRSDAEVMRYIREPQKRRETEKWIRLVSSRWEKDKMGFCAVIEKKSEKLIGWCGVWSLAETGEVEIGYAIEKEFWNQGLATEAAKVLLEYAFANIKTDRITAVADPENVSSRRVMEKLGMKFVRIDDFYERQLAQYAISLEEFLTRKNEKANVQRNT